MRGKVNFDVSEINPDEDHPRLCGEKNNRDWSADFDWGSPPPMRGKDQRFRFPNGSHRITPAYAGKSCGIHTGHG